MWELGLQEEFLSCSHADPLGAGMGEAGRPHPTGGARRRLGAPSPPSSLSVLQMGPGSLFHPLKPPLEKTQPAVLRGARVFLQQKSPPSLSNGGAM